MRITKERLESLRKQYPVGARVRLIEMKDPYAPVEPGTMGSVTGVDDAGTVHCTWDNGRGLGLIPGEDSFSVLPPEPPMDQRLQAPKNHPAAKLAEGPPELCFHLPQEVEDAMLEEACRQWCDFIGEAQERKSGEGFADFYREIREQMCQDQEFMGRFRIAPTLPELCFSTLPGSGALICIKRGESGYYPSDWDTGDRVKNRELADYNNQRLGVTPEQRQAMECGSMHGWNLPGADPMSYVHQDSPQISRMQMGGIRLE